MPKKSVSKFSAVFFSLIFVITPIFYIVHNTAKAEELKKNEAVIYYNEACGMCAMYVKNELPEMLEARGINNIIKKDYINEKEARKEMNVMMEKAEIPFSLQSHIMTFVGEKYVLGGHIPEHIINDIFQEENSKRFKKIIIYQDEMHGDVKDYKVWAIPNYANGFVGEVMTYPIDARITEYLDYLENNKKELLIRTGSNPEKKEFLLPVVIVSGFLDGINPCAFAVLLFFISFLFTLKRTKKDIWKTGAVYILAIFLAYLAIGFGLVGAVMLIDEPHAMAKIGAWLVIILGIINIIGLLFPSFPVKLRIPHVAKGTIKNYVYKATLPSAFILGFFVGLCTFPCSGGIYVAIIGLLVSQTTYTAGIAYLILYNIMFVMPLVLILLALSNKKALETFSKYEQSKVPLIKIAGAGIMIALGVIILVWFT
ncbi:MAG: cytochrome c biogenesis protein CcdA [Patescibacteria group bacterium]|nr:cytochrome c biogenesis protein CcdA [Patescibacteria group bacterium]